MNAKEVCQLNISMSTPFKFTLRKEDGELTIVLLAAFGTATKCDASMLLKNAERQLYTAVGEDVDTTLTRNKAIYQLIANEVVGVDIVDLNQVYESQFRTMGDILVVVTQCPILKQFMQG